MKPLEEYMLFTKTGAENITVINSQGVRSAQCNAQFDSFEKLIAEPILNISLGTDKTWVEDPPTRIKYKSIYIDPSTEEEKTQVVFISLTALFIIIIICCIIEVYRSDRAHKKRVERETDEGIIWSKEQATKMHESPGLGIKPLSYKAVLEEKKEVNGINKSPSSGNIIGILKNNTPSNGAILNEGKAEADIAVLSGIRGKSFSISAIHCLSLNLSLIP